MRASLTIDDSPALATLSGIAGFDPQRPLGVFRGYMIRRISEQILAAGAGDRGGTARGMTWRPLKPLYVRADGTIVPAWGGVAKVRGQGTVLGRRQARGGRVAPAHQIMGGLAGGKLAGKMLRRWLVPGQMHMTAAGPFGAYQESLRQFLFFGPQDVRTLEKFALSFLRRQMAGKRGR